MLPTIRNLYEQSSAQQEEFILLLEGGPFRLEHIISHGDASPPDFWYDQEEPEWVALLEGEARLHFEEGKVLELKRGDYLLIPAGMKHRVDHTSEDAVWLALHFSSSSG